MSIVAGDWEVTRATKNIRYIGNDHGGTAPSYATVIEFHRWLQGLADNAVATGDDELDITNTDPSRRSTDNIITLINGYNITATEAEHLYDGSIIQGTAGVDQMIWDGIVNFGNGSVQIQILRNGAVLTDDWWNRNVAGTHTGSANASVLTATGPTWTIGQWIGYTVYNVTDGSNGLITANTSNTVTAVLAGGVENDWDSADVYQIGQGLNANATAGISHRFMILVHDYIGSGGDIDGRRLLGTCRRFGNTYAEFNINGTSRGNNVLALTDSSDLNNTTAAATVASWNTIDNVKTDSGTTVSGVNAKDAVTLNVASGAALAIGEFITIGATGTSEYRITNIVTNALTITPGLDAATSGGEAVYNVGYGYRAIDVDNNTTNEYYYSEWDNPYSINQFYERMKWLTRDSSTQRIFGLSGELYRGITHQIVVDTPSATDFFACEPISWNTGTGMMLAIDSVSAATTMWIQILTGIAPTDGLTITGATSTATCVVNVTVTSRTISKPFCGQSTGSAIIGAYGFGIEKADLAATDKVTSLADVVITPPNNVENTVGGLTSGEDRVLVAPWNGSSYDTNGDPAITKDQLSLDTALSAANITAVVVQEAIPADTPSIGWIRVKDNNGFERRLYYSSWVGGTKTFNISGGDYGDGNEDFNVVGASTGNDVYIAYIDKLANATTATFTSVQSGVRQLVVIVRDGGTAGDGFGIKQFISAWSQTSSPQTITAIRTSDV